MRQDNWLLTYRRTIHNEYTTKTVKTLQEAKRLARLWAGFTGHAEVRATEYRLNLTGDNREWYYDLSESGKVTLTSH